MSPEPSGPQVPQKAESSGKKLARWDWLVLPALSVLTVILVLSAVKSVGRSVINREGSLVSCMVMSDPATGWRGIPNSECSFKGIEHQLVRYQFNRCGDYTTLDCNTKSPGVYRIVLVGSSYGFGWGVSKDQSFATLLPRELSQQTGRRIELYNESMVAASTGATARRVDDALAAKPDLLLWTLSPQDIAYDSFVAPAKIQGEPAGGKGMDGRLIDHHGSLADEVKAIFTAASPLEYIRQRWSESSFGLALQHYLFQSRTLYVKLYLMSGDRSGFLHAQFSPDWQERLKQFDMHTANAADAAQKAGIPLVVTLIPDRILSTVVSMDKEPAGIDGYKLDHELRAIVVRHGGIFIDVLPDFHAMVNPQQYYMPVDDHPYASGHRLIAVMLASNLAKSVPALEPVAQATTRVQPGR